jgi:hypothetical protein
MKIDDKVVQAVVTEASAKMSDPNYSAVAVGGFVQSQPPAAQFVTAHEPELGSAEAIIGVIFHAALLAECFKRASNRSIRTMSYEDLDSAASSGDPLETLAKRQPALSDFIVSNVEAAPAKRLLALLALAMDHVSI